MKPVNRRIVRLLRLERIRDIAKQASLSELAEAERNLTHMETLSQRVTSLSSAYAARTDAEDGYMLSQQNRFSEAMGQVAREVSTNANNARILADQKLRTVEECERRRSAVEDVRVSVERTLKNEGAMTHIGASRKNGTVLE